MPDPVRDRSPAGAASSGPPPACRGLRRHRGARGYRSGLAAEESVARAYTARGGTIRERRWRAPEGEIDLIVEFSQLLVFVEVKQRRRGTGADSPIGDRQWERLGSAANRYMMEIAQMTGAIPGCRFDAALLGPDGRLEIIENARSFDAL